MQNDYQYDTAYLQTWADSSGNGEALRLAVNIFQIESTKFLPINNYLSRLRTPVARKLIATWTDEPLLQILLELADAFFANEMLIENYPAVAINVGHESFFGGSLAKQFYLPSLVLTQNQISSPDQHVFGESIMLWLVVRAARACARDGVILEENIAIVSRWLARSFELQDTTNLLNQLESYCGSFLSGGAFKQCNFQLSMAARQIDVSNLKKKPTVIGKIEAVANSEIRLIPNFGQNLKSEPLVDWLNSIDLFHQISFHSIQNDEEINSVEEGVLSEEILVDASLSFEEKELSAKSILLQTAEQSHFLPISWHAVQQDELSLLWHWIQNGLVSKEADYQLGSALVYLAIISCRSLERVSVMARNDQSNAEWRLSMSFEEIHRQRPIRRNSRYPSVVQKLEISPFVESYSLVLPKAVSRVLAKYNHVNLTSGSLQEMWHSKSDKRLEDWFHGCMVVELPRISSSHLSHVLPIHLYNSSGNSQLVRLMGSHPQSALPGSSAYHSFSAEQLNSCLIDLCPDKLRPRLIPPVPEHSTVIGSYISPSERLLEEEIKRAQNRVFELMSDSGIEYHNAVVSYVTLALLAATGCRPVVDPFESFSHFNLDERLVYIDDKAADKLHQGRLVPLAKGLVTILRGYVRYLGSLKERLVSKRHPLGSMLQSMSDIGVEKVPFLFFIEPDGRWSSVTPTQVFEHLGSVSSLPKNMYRHRFIQGLTKLGVDVEVIDGWSGHAERLVATYCDVSPRCWITDAKRYMPQVDELFESLGFSLNQFRVCKLPKQFPANESQARLFGSKRRRIERKKQLQKTLREVKEDASQWLQLHSLDWPDLVDKTAEELSYFLQKSASGMVHPQAFIRRRWFLNKLRKVEKETGRRFAISRWMLTNGEEQSPFSPHSASALTVVGELSSIVDRDILKGNVFASRVNHRDNLLAAAVVLSVQRRISSPRVLKAIVHGKDIRVILINKRYYLEYSEFLEMDGWEASVSRQVIPEKVAAFINAGLARKSNLNWSHWSTPVWLRSFDELLCRSTGQAGYRTIEDWLKAMANLVDQANVVEFPGVLASAVARRVPSTSFKLPAWLEIMTGRRVSLPPIDMAKEDAKSSPSSWLMLHNLNNPNEYNADQMRTAAIAFAKKIRDELSKYSKSTPIKTAKEIDKLVLAYSPLLKSGMLLLGSWIADRVRQGRRDKKASYAQVSIKTYFSSLSPVFESVAYNADLLQMDDVELTELYEKMLLSRQNKDAGVDQEPFARELQDFQLFAERFGVETPQWTELELPFSASKRVSAGYFSDNTYFGVLQFLDKADQENQLFSSQAAVLLILTRRFGLRPHEATGLQRRDWINSKQACRALARRNRERDLKTDKSRRIVPLLYQLTTVEKQFLKRWATRYDTMFPERGNGYLFFDKKPNEISLNIKRMRLKLNQLLKEFSGDKRARLYDGRHTFHNDMVVALCDMQFPVAKKLYSKHLKLDLVRQCVLGMQKDVSRRTGMALARLMGHSVQTTGLIHYNHLRQEWLDAMLPNVRRSKMVIVGVPQPEHWPKAKVVDTKKLNFQPEPYQPLQVDMVLRLLRLVANGKTFSQAGEILQLQPELMPPIQTFVESVGKKQRFAPAKGQGRMTGKDFPIEYLKRISIVGWERMITYAESQQQVPLVVTDQFSSALLALHEQVGPDRQIYLQQGHELQQFLECLTFWGLPIEIINFTLYEKSTIEQHLVQRLEDLKGARLVRSNKEVWSFKRVQNGSGVTIDGFVSAELKASGSNVVTNSIELIIAWVSRMICNPN